jgi:hypothetical protein
VAVRVGQVPKVTKIGAFVACLESALLPLPCSADEAIRDNAEPEIDDQSPIKPKWMMAGQMKQRPEKEIYDIAENDGEESVEQIDEH